MCVFWDDLGQRFGLEIRAYLGECDGRAPGAHRSVREGLLDEAEHASDEHDVTSAIAGDRDALRRLWQEHRRWVAAILIAYKPRESEVEDLLQTVALQVVRKISGLRESAAFRPWLRTIAINTARGEGRKVTRRGPMLRLTGETEGAPSGPGVDGRDEASRVMELARELPEGYREPLLMRCARGMSYRQIGAILDLPETTVETRIARGRRMLRELVGESAPAEGAGAGPRKAGRRPGRWSVVV